MHKSLCISFKPFSHSILTKDFNSCICEGNFWNFGVYKCSFSIQNPLLIESPQFHQLEYFVFKIYEKDEKTGIYDCTQEKLLG